MNIKRLKEKRGLFNTKMIEDSCDIPSTVLASYFSGRRNTLKEDHVENIEKYLRGVFEYLFEPLSHESVQVSNPVSQAPPSQKKASRKSKRSVEVGDMVDTKGWKHLLRGIMSNGSMRGRLEDGKIRVTSV